VQSKIVLLTFADGSENFVAAGKRLAEQAKELNLFERIICLDSASLGNLVPEFSVFANNHNVTLGPYFSYQNAKAFALKAALTGRLGAFEQVVYLDAGCEIVTNPISRLKLIQVFRRVQSLPIGVVQATVYREKHYTKKRVLEFLAASKELSDSFQVQPGVVILNTNAASLELIELWIRYLDPNLDLVQDPRTSEGGLVAHRRDQSIFSILWKQNQGDVFDFYWNTPRNKSRFLDAITSTYAIQAIRNRTGRSNLSTNPLPELIALSIGIVASPLLKFRRNVKKCFAK
jgi:hypothetical protein